MNIEGLYFLGFVDHLTFEAGNNAYVRLLNPKDSNVNIHVKKWFIDKIKIPYNLKFWKNSNLEKFYLANYFTSANFRISPFSKPTGIIQYKINTNDTLDGVSLNESDLEQIILTPGESLLLELNSKTNFICTSCRVTLGFWEEKINNNVK